MLCYTFNIIVINFSCRKIINIVPIVAGISSFIFMALRSFLFIFMYFHIKSCNFQILSNNIYDDLNLLWGHFSTLLPLWNLSDFRVEYAASKRADRGQIEGFFAISNIDKESTEMSNEQSTESPGKMLKWSHIPTRQIFWTLENVCQATLTLDKPNRTVTFSDELEMRKVYLLIYNVFRCK